jgi:hypothetical protein
LEQFNQHETLDKTINQNTPQANYPALTEGDLHPLTPIKLKGEGSIQLPNEKRDPLRLGPIATIYLTGDPIHEGWAVIYARSSSADQKEDPRETLLE